MCPRGRVRRFLADEYPITEYSRGTGYGRRWGGEVHPDGVTYVYDRDCAIILDLYDRPTTRNGTQYR